MAGNYPPGGKLRQASDGSRLMHRTPRCSILNSRTSPLWMPDSKGEASYMCRMCKG